eukprot:GEMP01008413.1.p1 GENE.GEMP01008413.1~~GEMP01008413.1.p1  ORF type:complete len:701 (+),score=86.21 GEMP01008413.1:78-2105(+)
MSASSSRSIIFALLGLASAAGKPCNYAYHSRMPNVPGASAWNSGDMGCIHSCAATSAQSPIDIESSSVNQNVTNSMFYLDDNIGFDWSNYKTDCSCKNTGDLLSQKYDCSACNMTISARTKTQPDCTQYKLLQFHMHTQSEHAIDGKHYDADIQFVHGNKGGVESTEYLVVGLFLEATTNDAEVHPFAKKLFGEDGTVLENKDNVITPDDLALLYSGASDPFQGEFYHYKGGFTTPPCTEIVQWFVLSIPIKVRKDTIDLYNLKNGVSEITKKSKFDLDVFRSARPTQNANNTSHLFKGTTGAAGNGTCGSFRRTGHSSADSEYHTVQTGLLGEFNYTLNFYDSEDQHISPWHDIPHKNVDGFYNFVCEIPKGTTEKMEIVNAMQKEKNPIKQDTKVNKTTNEKYVRYVTYRGGIPANYGFLAQTWENPSVTHDDHFGKLGENVQGDGDPVDVLVLGNKPCNRGDVFPVKLVGGLALLDSDERDWKLVAVRVRAGNADDKPADYAQQVEVFRSWYVNYKGNGTDGQPLNKIEVEIDAETAKKVVLDTYKQWADEFSAKTTPTTMTPKTTATTAPKDEGCSDHPDFVRACIGWVNHCHAPGVATSCPKTCGVCGGNSASSEASKNGNRSAATTESGSDSGLAVAIAGCVLGVLAIAGGVAAYHFRENNKPAQVPHE